MAVYGSHGLAEQEISVHYGATYLSSEVNRVASALAPGVYRGFHVEEAASPGKKVKITKGADKSNFAVFVDETDGVAVSLALEDDVTIDVPFTDPVGSDLDLYVWMSGAYSVGSTSTATIYVSDVGDVPADAIRLAKITVPVGQSSIVNSYISEDETNASVRTVPEPYASGTRGTIDHNHFSYIPTSDEKAALDAAASPSASNAFVTADETTNKVLAGRAGVAVTGLSAATKVQLSGKFFVGSGVAGTAQKWFWLQDSTDNVPLLGEDYKPITVGAVYDSTDAHELDPSTEADGDGFYENPVLHLDFSATADSSFTGDFIVLALERSLFSGLDPESLAREAYGIKPVAMPDHYSMSERNKLRFCASAVASPGEKRADFYGSDAFKDAISWLESEGGGRLYLRGQSYRSTISTTVTITKKIIIIGEPFDDKLPEIGITAPGGIRVNGGYLVLEDVQVKVDSGDPDYMIQVSGSGSLELRRCRLYGQRTDKTVLDLASFNKVFVEDSILDDADSTNISIDIDNGEELRVVGSKCGGQVKTTGSARVRRAIFENVEIQDEIESDVLLSIGYGTTASGMWSFRNIRVVASAVDSGFSENGMIVFAVGAEGNMIHVDGLDIVVPTSLPTKILYEHSIGGEVMVSGVGITSSGTIGANAADGGIAYVTSQGGIARLVDVVSGTWERSTNYPDLFSLYASSDGQIELSGFVLDSLADGAGSGGVQFVAAKAVGSTSSHWPKILIERCQFDGHGIDNATGVSIQDRTGGGADTVDEYGQVDIVNCRFQGLERCVQVSYSTGSGEVEGRVSILENVMYSSADAFPLVEVRGQSKQVDIRGNKMVGSKPTYGLISVFGSGSSVRVVDNYFETADDTRRTVYLASGANVAVIIGNSGTGKIEAYNADNHIGIGDGDYNVNRLAVLLN